MYLRTACELESHVLQLRQIRDNAESRIDGVLQANKIPGFQPPHSKDELDKGPGSGFSPGTGCGIGAAIGFVLSIIAAASGGVELFIAGMIILTPIVTCGVMFIQSIISGVTAIRSSRRFVQENAVAKKNWEERKKLAEKRDAVVLVEFSKVTSRIGEMRALYESMLREHYDNGPVYHKYQKYPAVCQFLEYFESGRVEDLSAAYNLYEQELRMDKLIDNSQAALNVLYQIRDNQSELYNGLIMVRDSVNAVNFSLNRCIDSLDKVAYNQEIIKLNTRQAADATTLIAQVEYYKNQHDLPMMDASLKRELKRINSTLPR